MHETPKLHNFCIGSCKKKPGCDFPWLGGTAALSSLDIKLHLLKTLEIFQTLSYISKHHSDALGNPKWGATCETICYPWTYWMSVWCFLMFRLIKMCSCVLGKMFWVTSGRVTGTCLRSLGFEIFSMACSCWDYFGGYSLNTSVINFQALPICNCSPKIICGGFNLSQAENLWASSHCKYIPYHDLAAKDDCTLENLQLCSTLNVSETLVIWRDFQNQQTIDQLQNKPLFGAADWAGVHYISNTDALLVCKGQ